MNAHVVPIFLSSAGFAAVREIYGRRNPLTDRPAQADYERAREIIFDSDWNDYDQIYLALYTLRLTGGKWLPNRRFSSSAKLSNSASVQVDFTLNLDVAPNYAKQWLLDEWAVADIMNFRMAVDRAIPLESAVIYVGFGCFMISFLISAPVRGGLSRAGVRTSDGQDVAVLREYLGGATFDAIKSRYQVSRMDILVKT